MDLSILVGRIEEAILNNEDITFGIRIDNGNVYYGIVSHNFIVDPIYLGPAPSNVYDVLYEAIVSKFKDIIIPMTVHTFGGQYTYYLTLDDVFIQFPEDDPDWIINRMHQDENMDYGSR